MLQRRLTGALLLTLAATPLVACGDEPIEDNLVRPGITAIEESRDLACGADATTIRAAIDAYTLFNGEPPSDEAALVDGGLLRTVSEGWDVVDGELVAQHPSCGEVGQTAAAPSTVDIVTDSAPMSPDDLLAMMSDAQIDEVGGRECARELVAIFAAAERFIAELDREPADVDDLVAEGFLESPPSLWVADDDELRPTAGSGCTDLASAATDDQDELDCGAAARDVETAYQAYIARHGPGAVPTESDLVGDGLLRAESELVDLDAQGNVVAAAGSECAEWLGE